MKVQQKNTLITNKIRQFPVTFGSHGVKLDGKVLLPVNAVTERPVPAVVVCHGFGSSHRAVETSARILAKKGIAGIIFDFRGHGTSGGAMDGKMAEDVTDAWNVMKQVPGVDKSRMGIIGHSLGAMSAIMGAAMVDLPRILVALACPPIIDREMIANATAGFGHWGHKNNSIIEFPRHGTFPWIKGIAGFLSRIYMYISGYHVRIDLQSFIKAVLRMNMAGVVNKLDSCTKLFVFCDGDTITPYDKSVFVFEAACEPKQKILAKGHHGTPICRGELRSQWTNWVADKLLS